MADKLRLVKSESELRSGLLVELKACATCGHSHRHLLLGPDNRDPRPCAHCGRVGCGWRVPQASHQGDAFICPDLTIRQGRLFIVDTGLETPAAAQTRIRKLVRNG